MTAEDDAHNAEQAGFILSHPLYKGAYDAIEREIFEQLAAINMHDKASQEELLRSLKNLRRVRAAFELHVERGIVAKAQLAHKEAAGFLRAVGY